MNRTPAAGEALASVFPARAGMNRGTAPSRASRHGRVPRASGDEPAERGVPGGAAGSVPRASGDEPTQLITIFVEPLVFPARAGMNRRPASLRPAYERATRVPRASGDEPDLRRPDATCVPRASGDEPGTPRSLAAGLGVPRASGDEPLRIRLASRIPMARVPRASGDEPWRSRSASLRSSGCSPRERG